MKLSFWREDFEITATVMLFEDSALSLWAVKNRGRFQKAVTLVDDALRAVRQEVAGLAVGLTSKLPEEV